MLVTQWIHKLRRYIKISWVAIKKTEILNFLQNKNVLINSYDKLAGLWVFGRKSTG